MSYCPLYDYHQKNSLSRTEFVCRLFAIVLYTILLHYGQYSAHIVGHVSVVRNCFRNSDLSDIGWIWDLFEHARVKQDLTTQSGKRIITNTFLCGGVSGGWQVEVQHR